MNPLKEVETQIKIEFPFNRDAEITLKAIEPEIMDSPSERARTGIECREKTVKITITARDTASLRASLNSYLRWLILSQQILELKHDMHNH